MKNYRFLRLLMVIALGPLPYGRTQTAEDTAVSELGAVTVSASRIAASDVEGPQAMDTYDPAFIDGSGAFSVAEFISTLPEGEEGTTTLVLIDGRPTYLDPNALPMGMIAGIEMSREGSMPQYGEFHNGRIINIRLKPDHTSSEIGAKFNGAFAGGGAERTARLAGATNRDRLRVIYSFDFRENEGLSATDRAFSREQDHRDTGGRDLRLAWGHAAVVTAVEGTLHGLMNAQGEPVRTALAPLNQDGRTLTPGDFLPPDPTVGDVPYGQRRFNSAAYRELVSPSQSKTVNLGFTFALSEQFNLEVNASHNDSRGQNLGPPPISPSSSQTVVPAAYNPFNQDVSVGMIHETFGPTFRRQQSARDQIGLNLEGDLWDDWDLELSMGYRYNDSARRGDELDPAKLATALTAEDPAQRFNPFADTRYFDPGRVTQTGPPKQLVWMG